MWVKKLNAIFLLSLFGSISMASDNLIVIYDSGNTHSVINGAINAMSGEDAIMLAINEAKRNARGFSPPTVFPVVTNGMTLGPLETNKTGRVWAVSPIFIIGYDEYSIKWLKHRKNALKELNAIGIVNNVGSKEELSVLQEIAGDLVLYPSPIDTIAAEFEIKRYPVLVSKWGMEQ